MSSIFRKDDNYVDKPKRNTYDLGKANNLTLKMGELVPVLCQSVYPGDSFKIDPTFALRYMPQVFPVQTRQRASIKYYYVRNRNLWKDWMDFIGKTKNGLVPPYLDFTDCNTYHLRPSSLADYMNFPVKVYPLADNVGDPLLRLRTPDIVGNGDYVFVPNGSLINNEADPFSIINRRALDVQLIIPDASGVFKLSDWYGSENNTNNDMIAKAVYSNLSSDNQLAIRQAISGDAVGADISGYYNYGDLGEYIQTRTYRIPMRINTANSTLNYANTSNKNMVMIYRTKDGVDLMMTQTKRYGYQSGAYVEYYEIDGGELVTRVSQIDTFIGYLCGVNSLVSASYPVDEKVVKVNVNTNELYWCDIHNESLPFYSQQNPDGLRMSALPFRAVQAIYNALIRNAENNPLMINGQPEYNKYILSDEGGARSVLQENLLNTYYANWADDRFTTALPSPQQGNAPLVGLTGVSGATVVLGNEDGSQSTVHLQVDSDTGNVVMVDGVSDGSPEYLNDAMMSAVEYGITINDLRNVNAFQKWLENNIRRGYKYKDQLMSHYGVNARFDVLDMPEFIGGVTRDVNVNQVTSTATTDDAKLGEYAGQSYVMGDGHSIEHYCDEHGFIIGLMSVTPMPIYQDALNKMWLMNDPFDYYFPEFGKIGMQPITKKEISFSQSVLQRNGDETFGYQRAWYDMLESLDEVHGLFRDDLRNFLIARDFSSVPELGSDFLTINPEDVNNTFYSLDNKDKIIGQIYHKIISKRPVPLFGIPSIE